MFKGDVPKPDDLFDIGDAQQPSDHGSNENIDDHRAWSRQVTHGVMAIMGGNRGQFISESAKLDLCKCLDLLDKPIPLPFDWDISIYRSHGPLRRAWRPTKKIGLLPNDRKYGEFTELEEDDDDDGLDPVACPTWNAGEVHIVKLPLPPYWGMAR